MKQTQKRYVVKEDGCSLKFTLITQKNGGLVGRLEDPKLLTGRGPSSAIGVERFARVIRDYSNHEDIMRDLEFNLNPEDSKTWDEKVSAAAYVAQAYYKENPSHAPQ